MENTSFANNLKPKKLDDIIGQEHLVSKDKVIYNLIKNNKMFSSIFYGPSGSGKTSLANVIALELNIKTRFLNAVINTKKDFEVVFEETKIYGSILLIVDEIHRLNKDKQDLLLPRIENESIILIGLTTSNPYYSINPAIRSRVQIYELNKLTNLNIEQALINACKKLNIKIENDAIKLISRNSNGDLRYAYNLLEVLFYSMNNKKISKNDVINLSSKPIINIDKDENEYYDVLSAFQKSIRGSCVNAALHYLSRLLVMGDLDSIYRRLAVIAYEDIGLANPLIGVKVMSCIEACKLVGLKEARIPLSALVIDMCLSPKSNSAVKAIDNALKDVKQGITPKIMPHINSIANGYKYPFDYPKNYVNQKYMPDELINRKYYIPSDNKYESILKQTILNIEKINKNK